MSQDPAPETILPLLAESHKRHVEFKKMPDEKLADELLRIWAQNRTFSREADVLSETIDRLRFGSHARAL
jgi:hypothetical protein